MDANVNKSHRTSSPMKRGHFNPLISGLFMPLFMECSIYAERFVYQVFDLIKSIATAIIHW